MAKTSNARVRIPFQVPPPTSVMICRKGSCRYQAMAAASRILKQASTTANKADFKNTASKGQRPVSFRELADDAIAYIKQAYARPADDVARTEVVKEWFGGRAAESITREEVKAALNSATEEKKWSLSTRHHYQNVLSLIYRLALEHDPLKVEKSPVIGIRRKKENNERVRFLTPAEEKRLHQTLRFKPQWAEHLPEVDLAIHTGLRRTNMYVDLVWENVDLKERIATIPTTKNDDPVYIPLNEDAMRALMVFRSRGDRKGRVIRNAAGETLNVNAHWFVDAIRQAKIPNFRWHDLRHTYASRLRQKGVPLGNIAELLGHKGLKMTRRYAHLAMSNQHEVVSRLQNPSDTTTDTSTTGRLPMCSKPFRIIYGGEWGPVTFPAFKAGDSSLRGSNGGFDFHTPPPYLLPFESVDPRAREQLGNNALALYVPVGSKSRTTFRRRSGTAVV